jgi:hypothetical protein
MKQRHGWKAWAADIMLALILLLILNAISGINANLK